MSGSVLRELNPTRALIFRIVHRDNVPWIVRNGLHCRNSDIVDPDYINIGNIDLIKKRHTRDVLIPPYGTLSDYIPFYFTPLSVMLFNIKTGHNGVRQRRNEEICILVNSIPHLVKQEIPFLFTDRHAYLTAAQYFAEPARLDHVDWKILQNRDFKKSTEYPEKLERYQAETLVHRHLPINALRGIVCYTESVRDSVATTVVSSGLDLRVIAKPDWYFR